MTSAQNEYRERYKKSFFDCARAPMCVVGFLDVLIPTLSLSFTSGSAYKDPIWTVFSVVPAFTHGFIRTTRSSYACRVHSVGDMERGQQVVSWLYPLMLNVFRRFHHCQEYILLCQAINSGCKGNISRSQSATNYWKYKRYRNS